MRSLICMVFLFSFSLTEGGVFRKYAAKINNLNNPLSATQDKIESQENTPESAVAISEMEIKAMVLKFSREIKTNSSLQKKEGKEEKNRATKEGVSARHDQSSKGK